MKTFLVAGWLVFLGGCVTTPIPGASRHLLGFLDPGETTRQEIILTLGQPSASFEDDTILTYRIGEDPNQGRFVITPKLMSDQRLGQPFSWETVRYSLVLVFDDRGVLAKHKLVPVQ